MLNEHELNALIALLQNSGLHVNNATLEKAIRFAESQGWTFKAGQS